MAAATITTKPEGVMAFDHAIITLSDGETYISKLSKPYGAVLSEAESTSTAGSAVNLDYALSGRTFTIRYKCNGAITDQKVSILVYGQR